MQTIDRERDRKSLQDLAKMAQGMTPPPSAASFGPVPSSRSVTSLPSDSKKDDSGIVDLAAASAADPHAAARAQQTPLASQSLFDDHVPPPPPVNAPPASVPPVSGPHIPAAYAYQQPAPSVPPPPVYTPSAPPPAYASVHPIGPQLSPQKKKSGGGVVFAIGSLLAISAAAAGGFLYINSHKPAPAASTPVTQPAVVADNAQPAEPAAPGEEAKPSENTMDPNALPSVSSPAKSSGGSHVVASKSTHAKAPKAEADEPVAKAEKPAVKAAAEKAEAKAEPPAPSGPPGDLGAAMAAAVPAKEEVKPAAAAGGSASMGNVPQKPSQGAVTGAIGAVLPAARACLGPDDPISRASVVFNSDGSVYSVTVSGGAAGKPAEPCIKDSLKKAKLTPFAETSYTANITIRHQ
ncbi:MAG: hypothetical protein KIT84_40260 [Labilithrix sp.]|nr:hypothetical protein [Labilithrix sp.]MCW5817301.1 hypothetical protein [Labilithrix sp.]